MDRHPPIRVEPYSDDWNPQGSAVARHDHRTGQPTRELKR